MTKTELIETVAARTGESKAAVGKVHDAIFEAIAESVLKDGKHNVQGFGTFEKRSRSAREGRNPKTAEKITVPASTTVGFKASGSLKERVN